jgi:hypothetical protein
VTGYSVPDVSSGHGAFIFKVLEVPLERLEPISSDAKSHPRITESLLL